MKSQEIRTANLATLKSFADELGIEIKPEMKKAEILELVLAANAAAAGTKMSNDVDLTQEMKDVLAGETSKAEKFRKLHELGMPTAQIARETNSHYSFVHGTLSRAAKKVQVAEVVEEVVAVEPITAAPATEMKKARKAKKEVVVA